MQLDKRVVGDVTIVTIKGEITLKKQGDVALQDNLRELIQQGQKRVLVDLGGVSYIDSAGLGQLVQAYSTTKYHGGSLKLFNLSDRIKKLLAVTQLTRLFGTCDYADEAQALASFAES